jgi:hypothetical protein
MAAIMRSIALMSAVWLMLGCERMETVDAVYPDFAAAVRADAVGDTKWIPAFLPSSATHIRDVHNLDTNEQWLSFAFNTPDRSALTHACKPVRTNDIAFPRKSPGTWWPKGLTRSGQGREPVEKIYDYYSCNGHSAMALARERSEAYYWTWVE